MVSEMQALDDNGTWDLVPLPTGMKTIGCHWAFAVKFNLDGSVTRLKALLVAKVMIRLIELVILILFLL